ncbi:prepilin-type N-terminal cleavage/methylation domain-containing protein [Candidatus Margulisiibacteriota bacterium]
MNKQGFTLVELLLAAALFVAAVAGFNYLLKAGAVTVDSAARLSRAVYTLQTKMEEVRSYPFSYLTSLNGRTFAKDKGRISVAPVLADLVRVELELEWDPRKVPLKLTTLRSDH